MAAAAKSKPANGSAAKPSSTSGTSTPVSVADKRDTSDATTSSAGRPDKKVYDAEQDRIKGEIDALQVKLSAVRDKISLATKSGSGNERRTTLKSELDGIRDKQSANKASRSKILEQVKVYQENISKKIKDLEAAKSKTSFRSVAEVDAHVRNLEKQIESGNMKLAEEKRALAEISTCKRNRRVVESFQADQDAIETDRRAVDELKKQLDDPELKAVSERFDKIKSELNDLKKEEDEAYANRSKLFEERDNLQGQINALYNEKRESAQKYREANDRYWTKVNEDRARRAERARAQRAAEEAQKKHEIAQRLRDEAEIPAYQAQIEDCQTLIDALSGKTTGDLTFKSAGLMEKVDIAGVAKLDIRKIEAPSDDGLVARKKKGDDEESYFVGGKGKGKGNKKSSAKANGSSNSDLNIPFSTLSALLSLSIPPPTSSADVPRVIENLKTKKAWFEGNQARTTAENIAKAEAEIKRLTGEAKEVEPPETTDPTPPNGGGERPGEPAPTPKVADAPAIAVPSEEVVEKLESVAESEASS
ncbi:hypothetical protein D9758_001028 [Tetrapyrgos nigripes]|uniref:Nuclear segregation protein Bfr1 n=1 Tax=Tetrapyrgos nigripes TaxID=182062 RepID=A0A8H5LU57_9AGAR|nr:hypothetical protein D9758_001028 [Tetrapyrgos nigripes]